MYALTSPYARRPGTDPDGPNARTWVYHVLANTLNIELCRPLAELHRKCFPSAGNLIGEARNGFIPELNPFRRFVKAGSDVNVGGAAQHLPHAHISHGRQLGL